MENDYTVKVKDNSGEVEEATARAAKRGLFAIGLVAENHAKTDKIMPVNTGRARNSITFAMAGGEAHTKSYKTDDGKETHKYSGKMDGEDGEFVAIGSNVEYFPYIEEGGLHMSARHVLRRAATDHNDEYQELMEKSMKNA